MATLDEKRAQAKAAGYSDAEIDAHLAAMAPAGEQDGPNPLAMAAGAVGVGAAGYGAVKAAQAVASRAPKLARVAGKLIARQVPGVGQAMDMAEAAQELRGPSPAPSAGPSASPPSPTTQAAPPEKIPANLVKLTEADIAMHPNEFGKFAPGQTVYRKTYEGVKMTPQPAPSVTKRAAATKAAKAAPKTRAATASVSPESPTTVKDVGPAASPAPKIGTATEPLIMARPSEAMTRHSVKYFSDSHGVSLPIEDMHISHLKNAFNKLGTKLSSSERLSPVTQGQFDAIKDELVHRAKVANAQGGELTVHDRPVAGSAKGRAAAISAAQQEVAQAEASAAEGAAARSVARGGLRSLGGTALGIAGYINPPQLQESAPQIEQLRYDQLIRQGLNPDDARQMAHESAYKIGA